MSGFRLPAELSAILDDPGFVVDMRSNANDFWDHDAFDPAAHQREAERQVVQARQAITQAMEPASEAGRVLAEEWLETSARLMRRKPDREFRTWLHGKYAQHDPRASRFWQLVAIMKGQSPERSPNQEWAWIIAATKHHLAD